MARLIIFLLIITSSTLPLYAQNYVMQKAEVRFEIDNAGLTVNGKFDSIPSIRMTMPANASGSMTLEGSLYSASINTGIGIRDKHLRKSDYFNTDKYPLIHLQSTGIRKNGTGYQGNFDLQIKQITRPVSMAIVMTEKGKLVEMAGKFTIDRRDFEIGGNSITLSDKVVIHVQAVFQKTP
jgi:polyisoprenoid-binding protein YceI